MNSRIKIYKVEKLDGLAEKIKASASIAFFTQLQPIDPETTFAQKLIKAVASKDHPSETLYPMQDVLVTTGWNLNTDVFDNGETWIARNTPVHHPLNFQHNEKQIIGNITASQAVDDSMNPINDDLAVDELPEKFHILNGSVIYRVWQDEEHQKLIDQTIAEIPQGLWYVSMECIFKGFDYAVIRPDGSKSIIPRTEESAFLTKYLRQYNGPGVYKSEASGEEFKIGRVLRNINFIGKGLVRQPANPDSVILNHVSAFVSDLGYIKSEAEVTSINQTEPERQNPMSEPNVDIKRLEDKVAELVRENQTLANQLKERDGAAVKAEIDDLKNEVASRDSKIQTLETTVSELSDTVGKLTERAEDAETAKTKAEEELSKLQAEKVEQTRLAVLTGKGASAEKAAELVKKFAKFTDEEFNELVETVSVAWKKPEGETRPTKKPEEVINNAQPERDAALAVTEEPEEKKTDERIAKASKFIGGFLRYSKNVSAVTGQTQE